MADETTTERVCSVIASIFNIPRRQVNAQSSSETIESWDSMGHLMLVLELEQEFDRQFSPEQTEQMHDVASIVQIVDAGT